MYVCTQTGVLTFCFHTDVNEQRQAYLEALPAAPMYERSYMHRDVVSHAVLTPCGTDFLVTASQDGHIKFWKKMPEGVEFVKHYHSHLEPIHDLAVRDTSNRAGVFIVKSKKCCHLGGTFWL